MKVHDVIILGGGLAGLCLARQLMRKQPELQVIVLEKRSFPMPEAAHKVGESTVEIAAHYLENMLGLGPHIHQHQLPKFGLRFFFNKPEHERLSQGTELGLAYRFRTPSYQLDRGRLENYLAETGNGAFELQDGAKVLSVDEPGDLYQVRYKKDGVEKEIQGRWLVDAGGRAAILKKKFDLAEPVGHQVNAVWFRINETIAVDDWESWPPFKGDAQLADRRGLSTNHLMGEGFWVWLIPLASGATSVGIVADPRIHPLSQFNRIDKALDWLDQNVPICGRQIRPLSDKVMDFLALKHFSHGCKQVFSGRRWALTGEAGVFPDPFYSPGSDFIGIANTMITQLITDGNEGEALNRQAESYENLYQALFSNTLNIYQNQYPLFGNAQVMPFKIIWDYAVYWSFPAFAFIQGRLTELAQAGDRNPIIDEIGALNARMQRFFRKWHAAGQAEMPRAFLDQYQIPLLRQLNHNLLEPFSQETFRNQLTINLEKLRHFSAEIMAHAGHQYQALQAFNKAEVGEETQITAFQEAMI